MVTKVLALLAVLLSPASLARAAGAGAPASVSPSPVHRDPATGLELVHVKGGCYRMGDIYEDGVGGDGDGSDERPVHEVCVGDFSIGKYEVTQQQWRSIMGTNPSSEHTCRGDDCPVDNVTWRDVQRFIAALNARGGGTYRLPTEAEWEYAARSGGKNERYAGGNDLDSVSWYEGNSGYRTSPVAVAHPVGTKAPNGLGIHDMSGNVWEMTNDWYDGTYYSNSPRENPAGPASGEEHVKRGGCATGHPGNSRVSRRSRSDGPVGLTGFRVVRIP